MRYDETQDHLYLPVIRRSLQPQFSR